ncbi:hypothetical protein [Halorubrum sp. N11]|uniref:hypothetical protein n=1 Tax=Halorubrum sp. N11 TaxID=3402276 RepID=UPI003EBDD6C4
MPPLELPLGLGTSGLDDPAECPATVTAALDAVGAVDALERGERRSDPRRRGVEPESTF